jgi:LysR family transcriptional regulator, transcription activator of glutamate synthase operon
MEISYLKEFVVLAQTGNFMEAAEILYSAQSTLSKHIKTLELELGVPLFDRTTRKVSISKYGQLLLPYAQQIAELQEKYTADLQTSLASEHETLTLGSIYGLAQYNITDVLVSFKKSRPQSTFNVLQASSKDLTDALRQKKCELAFIRDVEDPEGKLVKIPYATDTIVAVLPSAHPLAGQKTIPLRNLADENFLLEVPNTMPYILSVKACQLSGFEPKVAITDVDREYLIGLVGKGMGVSLMLKQILSHFSSPEVSIVEILPTVATEISLCYLKDVKLSEAAKHFVRGAVAL